MRYTKFAQSILGEALDNTMRSYNQAIELLRDPDNFILDNPNHHKKRIENFLKIPDLLFGHFSLSNSYDHVQMIRNCFLDKGGQGQMKVYQYLSHISSVKQNRHAKLRSLLDDIDSFAFLVTEKSL